MDPRVEEILMAKIVADNSSRPSMMDSAGLGAALGGTLGVAGGRGLRGKMAGGVANALLGAGIGAGVNQASRGQSDEAKLLAKIQTEGEVSEMDKAVIRDLVAKAYSQLRM